MYKLNTHTYIEKLDYLFKKKIKNCNAKWGSQRHLSMYVIFNEFILSTFL